MVENVFQTHFVLHSNQRWTFFMILVKGYFSNWLANLADSDMSYTVIIIIIFII